MSKFIKIEEDQFHKCKSYQPYVIRQPIHEEYGLHIFLAKSYKNNDELYAHHNPVPRYFNFYAISQLLNGHGWYWTPKKGRQNFSKGQGVLMTPKTIHDYNAYDYYKEDNICFYGPIADHLFRAGVIKPGIISIRTNRRLLSIIELANIASRDFQIQANSALQQLLVELYLENQSKTKNIQQENFEKLLHKIYQNPQKWWSVREMADLMNMHINRFSIFFSKQIGMTPKKYIDRLKIKNAADDLYTSRLNIGTIAANYGYQNQFHFSKRFKEIIGISPYNYRKTRLS